MSQLPQPSTSGDTTGASGEATAMSDVVPKSESGGTQTTINVSQPEEKKDSDMGVDNNSSGPTTNTTTGAGAAAASTTASPPTTASSTSTSSSAAPIRSPSNSIANTLLTPLDALLFGPLTNCNENDRTRWQQQGFVFSDQPRTRFGLTQTAGGPCGVLAPIQAFILQRLLFGGVVPATMNGDIPVSPTPAQQDEALVWALTTVLTRCIVDTKAAGFTIVSGSSYDSLNLHGMKNPDEVRAFFTNNIAQLHGPLGVLTFVYSVLLSRGLQTIRADMDDPSSFLVGQFGHSSQELVNLMMIGRAVTNVFDGNKVLGDANDATAFRLKGIPAQNDIGFLTLLEALRYSTVGEYYKSPKFPIWVIGSSNHYTVMFSLDRRVGQLTTNQKKQRAARTAFDELDPENNGFIPVTSLPTLLQKLGNISLPAGTTADEVKRRLDPDGLGVILYERVITVLEQWEKQKAMIQAQASMPQTPFSCTACTFNNIATAATCEICGTPRPPPPPPPAKAEEIEIQNFTLYHFNGIEIPGKSLCECHKVSVSVVEGGLPPQIQGDVISEGQGLKEILLTRWPSCILDIDGVAKIS